MLVPGVGPEGAGFVAVLDASSWQELGRAEAPFGTPNRFHGIWLEAGGGGGSTEGGGGGGAA